MTALIEAHRFDLYDEPMATIADLETYAAKTSAAVIALAAQILGVGAEAAARPAGIASGIAGTAPQHSRFMPRAVSYTPRSSFWPDMTCSRTTYSRALRRLVSTLRSPNYAAWRAGISVPRREHMLLLPREALPAFLPLALVRPSLERLERGDAFAPAELPCGGGNG